MRETEQADALDENSGMAPEPDPQPDPEPNPDPHPKPESVPDDDQKMSK